MVIIYNNWLNTKIFYVLPTQCIYVFREQTPIISLHSTNWLVFIRETECVYCAVRTGYSNIHKVVHVKFVEDKAAL